MAHTTVITDPDTIIKPDLPDHIFDDEELDETRGCWICGEPIADGCKVCKRGVCATHIVYFCTGSVMASHFTNKNVLARCNKGCRMGYPVCRPCSAGVG